MNYLLLLIFALLSTISNAQEKSSDLSSLLFWTAQDWPCEFMEIRLFKADTTLVAKSKLKEKFRENRAPECNDSKVLEIENLNSGFYFFVAECIKEECYVCHGEGSYWQPIMQDKSSKQTDVKSKGNMEGTWRTCYICNGNGASSSTIWMDTLTLKGQQCRTVLLK